MFSIFKKAIILLTSSISSFFGFFNNLGPTQTPPISTTTEMVQEEKIPKKQSLEIPKLTATLIPTNTKTPVPKPKPTQSITIPTPRPTQIPDTEALNRQLLEETRKELEEQEKQAELLRRAELQKQAERQRLEEDKLRQVQNKIDETNRYYLGEINKLKAQILTVKQKLIVDIEQVKTTGQQRGQLSWAIFGKIDQLTQAAYLEIDKLNLQLESLELEYQIKINSL